jgi:hypothetical protein
MKNKRINSKARERSGHRSGGNDSNNKFGSNHISRHTISVTGNENKETLDAIDALAKISSKL